MLESFLLTAAGAAGPRRARRDRSQRLSRGAELLHDRASRSRSACRALDVIARSSSSERPRRRRRRRRERGAAVTAIVGGRRGSRGRANGFGIVLRAGGCRRSGARRRARPGSAATACARARSRTARSSCAALAPEVCRRAQGGSAGAGSSRGTPGTSAGWIERCRTEGLPAPCSAARRRLQARPYDSRGAGRGPHRDRHAVRAGRPVDLDRFRALAQHLVDNGSDGIVVAGTTGESPTLTDAEKIELSRAAVDAVGGRATVVAGAGTYDTALGPPGGEGERARRRRLPVVTPYYNKPPQRGIVEHFKAIAASTDKPIVVYNIPCRVVINIEPETIAQLAEIHKVSAVKQANDDLDAARQIPESGSTSTRATTT